MGVFLALVSSIVVGASDFLGGLAARRANTLTATLWSFVGATGLTAVVAVFARGVWSGQTVVAGLVAGVCTVLGFLTFYASLSLGRMAVSASIVAAIQATVPAVVAVTWAHEHLGVLGLLGALLAVGGAVTLSAAEGQSSEAAPARSTGRLPTALAVIAGLLFGGTVVALHSARDDAGPVAALVELALGLVIVVALAVGAARIPAVARFLQVVGIDGPTPSGPDQRAGVVIGLAAGLLLGLANLALIEALRIGPLAAVGVVSATYSMTTTLLAVVVLRERLRRLHLIGVTSGLVGCALLGLR